MKDLKEVKPEYADSQTNKQVRAEDLFGKFKLGQINGPYFPNVITTPPTAVPRSFLDQIQIYSNTSTGNYRLYWWDTNAGAWHGITATI